MQDLDIPKETETFATQCIKKAQDVPESPHQPDDGLVDEDGYRIPQLDAAKWAAELSGKTDEDGEETKSVASSNPPAHKIKFDISTEKKEANEVDLSLATQQFKDMLDIKDGAATVRRNRRG